MSDAKYKVTYILGAGASAKALPTVKPTSISQGYTNSLRQMGDKLQTLPTDYIEIRDTFITDLHWLADQGDLHGTPDTFAKLCQIKNDINSLMRIKNTLSLYFTIEQFIEKKIDSRYLQFILKILENNPMFSDNVKIINWNYDFQLQLAAENIQKEGFNYWPPIAKHSPPLVSYYPSLGHDFNVNHEKGKSAYSLIHLNGIAGFYYYEQTGYILNYFLNDGVPDINSLFDKYQTDQQYKSSLLSFAFEPHNNMNKAIRNRFLYANKAVEDTDFLVIIGYSFPSDNVETDEEIMNTIKSGCLKQIFFQDPYNDGSFLRDTFGIDQQISITHISNVEEFYIPRQVKMVKQA